MERLKEIIVGLQLLFVAFGALVLVPLLTGLSPAVALLSAGLGTLAFQGLTGRQVPIFLGSSFAFIGPLTLAIPQWGLAATQGAIMAVALVYLALALLVRRLGTGFINRLFPPVVVAPVIMVIGLALAPAAANLAMGLSGDGQRMLFAKGPALAVATVALYSRGLAKLLAVLAGIGAGYGLAVALGLGDFAAVRAAPWLQLPPVTLPRFDLNAILFLLPVALAPAIEHIGDIAVIGQVCDKPFLQQPGLHRTLAGDGVAVALAGLLGAANPAYRDALGTIGVAIRNLGNFPDGVAFAILIANGLVPLIDPLTQPRYR